MLFTQYIILGGRVVQSGLIDTDRHGPELKQAAQTLRGLWGGVEEVPLGDVFRASLGRPLTLGRSALSSGARVFTIAADDAVLFNLVLEDASDGDVAACLAWSAAQAGCRPHEAEPAAVEARPAVLSLAAWPPRAATARPSGPLLLEEASAEAGWLALAWLAQPQGRAPGALPVAPAESIPLEALSLSTLVGMVARCRAILQGATPGSQIQARAFENWLQQYRTEVYEAVGRSLLAAGGGPGIEAQSMTWWMPDAPDCRFAGVVEQSGYVIDGCAADVPLITGFG